MRGFVILLVVLHHTVLAYCSFGHVDRLHYALSTAPIVDAQRWPGFDLVVQLNDGFFMPLMFLLSGLFVRDGLLRKGRWAFLRARLLRLGLPFALAELTVVPLAYYPSFLQAGGAPGFPQFWRQTVTAGPWPSGPPWFIAVLLLFDAAAALLVTRRPRRSPPPATPAPCFVLLLAGSALLYVPLLVLFGPTRWLSLGPLAIQASRVLLYAAYFAAGVALGSAGMPGIVRFGEALARRCIAWLVLALLAATAFTQTTPVHAALSAGLPRWLGRSAAGLVFAAYCAAACFALPALFLRFAGRPGPFWTSLAANGFAIYLLHYPAVTWTQYALLPVCATAAVKALVTFAIALSVSWAAAALLRQAPALDRVIS